MCTRWLHYPLFLLDMGERPEGCTLDRINNERGYEPGNCRWATPAEQQRNRRHSLGCVGAVQVRWLCTDGGRTQTEVARAFGVSQSLVSRTLAGVYYAAGV